MEAQTARGGGVRHPEPHQEAAPHAAALRALLISSVGKTDACALAAEQRGFYLRTRASSYKRYPLRVLDAAALALGVALVAAAALL